MQPSDPQPASHDARPPAQQDPRRTYRAPALERLGPWRVLTLQQSVGIADLVPWPDDFPW